LTGPRLKLLLRAAVSLGLIALVIRKVDWTELGTLLLRLDLRWASLASILTPALIVGLAWRWSIFLRQQQIQLPWRTTLSLTWTGLFFNSCLPGSTGGDIVKIFQLCHLRPNARAAAAGSVIADRASALFALSLLAVIAFVIEPAPLRLLARNRPEAKTIVAVAVMVMLAGFVFLRAFRHHRWLARGARVLAVFGRALMPSRALAMAFLLALSIHLLNFLIIYFFARALEINISYAQVLLMMPVILFAVLLPVTINGHGLRELLLIGYFDYLGIGMLGDVQPGVQGMAVALSLLLAVNDLLWVLPGGIWHFWLSRSWNNKNSCAPAQI